MLTFRIVTCAALAAMVAGACAAQGGPRQAGAAASARGDNWIAANQLERAATAEDSPLTRFDLAAAYESTGRFADAATQYRQVLADGRSATFTIPTQEADAHSRASGLNLAVEARRRLAVIEARQGRVPAPEFVAGASASPFVGGPAQGVVSDGRARQLDKAARTANDE